MEAIVFAGGLGTRLRSAVPDRPKPMADVRGRPFLEYLLDHWIEQGITRFILSVGYRHEQIQAHFGSLYRGAAISYAIEDEPLGTGGALALAAQQRMQQGLTLVLNGDTYFPIPLAPLLSLQREVMVLRRLDHNDRYGSVELNADGRIVAFGRGGPLINGGIYLFSTFPQSTAPASLEQDYFPQWIQERPLYGSILTTPFIDIGIPADYHRFATTGTL